MFNLISKEYAVEGKDIFVKLLMSTYPEVDWEVVKVAFKVSHLAKIHLDDIT